MPVKDSKINTLGKCACCGSKTKSVKGTVCLNDGFETLYIARWNVKAPDHGIAFLVLVEGTGSCVSVLYSFQQESFMVVGADDYDWGMPENSLRVCERNEVIGTPLASIVFACLDEIWLHDKDLRRFYERPNRRWWFF